MTTTTSATTSTTTTTKSAKPYALRVTRIAGLPYYELWVRGVYMGMYADRTDAKRAGSRYTKWG